MNEELDAYLRPHRCELLFVVRYSVLLCLFAYFLVAIVPRGLGEISPTTYLLLMTGIVYSIAVFVIREREPGFQAILSTGMFLLVSLLLMFEHGPGYGSGILALLWVSWYIFFHNNLVIPLLVHAAGSFSIVFAEQSGYTPVWAMGDLTPNDWVRVLAVPFFPLLGGAYLVQQLQFGVIKSLLRESDARKRELDIQREKEIIDKALTQRYRLESVGRLASGVAHDFNNVLTVLMSCLEVLKVIDDGPTRDSIVKDMEAAVRSAESTSRQLLSLSTSGVESGNPADPRTSLRTLIANLKRLFPENIVIEEYVRGTPRVAVITGDFDQAVLNLCINARDSMQDGGTLTINCYEEPQDHLVIVEIGDTGTGMSEEILTKAIDPFFSTKIESDGTGLGLSQVYGAIQAVGGDIEIESGVGLGTKVRLLLPVAEPTMDHEEAADIVDADTGDRRILLLDDDKLVAVTMSRALVSAGYQVTTATSVSEAIGCLDDPGFNLLITDRGLPDGGPASVVSKFQKMSDGPVLLISGYETDDLFDEGVAFLRKPFAPSVLLNKLAELCRQPGSADG